MTQQITVCCTLECLVSMVVDVGNTISADISSSEEETVSTVASEPPCFVILGQSLQLRVALANRIFGDDLLPHPGDAAWHTVMFRYGSRNRVVPVDASVQSRSTGVNASAARRPAHSWKTTVPLSELEVTEDSGGHTAVEVRANHPLLHAGAKLAVGGDTGNALDMYTYCVRDAAPVIVYAVHRNGLLEEVREALIDIVCVILLMYGNTHTV